jgi:hypothetical protein
VSSNAPWKQYRILVLEKKKKLTLDPCKVGLLRATFYIQFIVLFEAFNLIYCIITVKFLFDYLCTERPEMW